MNADGSVLGKESDVLEGEKIEATCRRMISYC
jgi:hypothetical protein